MNHDAILFHGAGLVKQDRGYVFFGPSGVGKSTVTMLSPECKVLGDDMIVIKRVNQAFQICSSHFINEANGFTLTNTSAPMAGCYRLIQDKVTFIKPMSLGKATSDLLSNMPVVNKNPFSITALMDFCSDILSHVPCKELHFTKDNKFWRLIDD
jgi:hypothetical protein